jgi:hypothetical protein
VNAPQPCGGDTGHGCGKPVSSAPGRHPGRPWWHQSAACQAGRRHVQYARLREQAGLRPPLPTVICQGCGRPYQPKHADPVVGPFCGRPRCDRERMRRYRLAQGRALRRLADEYPERMAELLAEEAARIGTGGAQ